MERMRICGGWRHGGTPIDGACRRHWRWRGRGVLPLSSGARRLDGLPAAGEERADQRLDLACGGECADLLLLLVDHAYAALFGRALSRAWRARRLPDELPCHGLAPPWAFQGAD